VSQAATLELVLPDIDIWLKAFSRQGPDPMVVHAFRRQVQERRVLLVGMVRQALLARSRDARQFARLDEVLSGFPDLPVQARDHRRAAMLIQRLRSQQLALSPWQALLWAVAERLPAHIWSQERHWQTLAERGCPLA
jgi:hypothetical protein